MLGECPSSSNINGRLVLFELISDLSCSGVCFASSRSTCKGSNRSNSLRPSSQQIRYILLSVKGLNPEVISKEGLV